LSLSEDVGKGGGQDWKIMTIKKTIK
jgi:hypothetical protein